MCETKTKTELGEVAQKEFIAQLWCRTSDKVEEVSIHEVDFNHALRKAVDWGKPNRICITLKEVSNEPM